MVKKIHYCWFGKGEKNQLFYKCLESWKKYFPDYEIIEWNEKNFDINCNTYVKEAYNCKKYAFVSDFARLKIIYENGGIYFDTDVEVLKKIDSEILEKGYLAKETDNTIATGLGFCANPNNKIIKLLLDDYENIHFINNGEMDITTCVERTTMTLEKNGFTIDKNTKKIGDLPVFEMEYFCGFDVKNDNYLITPNTFTVHHYNGSWLNPKMKFINRIKRIISKIIGINNYKKIREMIKKIKKKK